MKNKVPNNNLSLLPPKQDLENTTILKKCVEAHKYLGILNGICTRLPNVNILLNNLVLSEAKDSSEIENIITTYDELYQGNISSENINQYTKEVLNYKAALYEGYSLIKKKNILTTNIICSIQSKLENNNAGIRKTPGTKLVNDKTGEIIYIPPEGEDIIRTLLKNLEEYLNTDNGVDDLIKLAVIHYQFEAIHPFYDGNGRTGRIINILFLILKNLLKYPILFLSHYIIQNKAVYYKLLQNVRDSNDWDGWVLYILKAISETSQLTISLIENIIAQFDAAVEYSKKKLPGSVYSKELIENIFFQPYTKIDILVQNNIAERRTASKYLQELEKIGILESKKIWKEKIYINKKLFSLLKDSIRQR